MAEPKRSDRREGGSLKMTAMIDVVFLLLIFFIVSTEFRTIEGLLPNNLPVGTGPDDSIVLRIELTEDPLAADPSFSSRVALPLACATASSPEEVTAVLKGMIARHGDLFRERTCVVILARPGVLYNDVVRVYDAVCAARMAKVSFAL